MKQVTVFCKVGRADPQPLATFADGEGCDAICSATEAAKFAELTRSGVSADRISFSRKTTEGSKK